MGNDSDYVECSECYESYSKGESHTCKEWEKEADTYSDHKTDWDKYEKD